MGLEQYLDAGRKVSLDVPRCPGGRFITSLVGHLPGRYIILENGEKEGVPLQLNQGDPCVVRFVEQEEVVGFASRVLGRISWPDHLVFIAYPENTDRLYLIKGKRFQVLLDAVVSTDPLAGDLRGRQADLLFALAADGCLMDCAQRPPLGRAVYLTFELPGQGMVRDLAADVKSVQPLGGRFQAVMAFEPGQDEPQARIDAYLGHLDGLQMNEALERLSSLDIPRGQG